jgi:hypothetical protein
MADPQAGLKALAGCLRLSGFHSAVNALPENTIWSVMERMQTLNGYHFFISCRPEQLKSSYATDFSAREALDYVRLMRMTVQPDISDERHVDQRSIVAG